jgi:hypothetical protein
LRIAVSGIGEMGFTYGLGLGSSSRGLRPGSEDWALGGRSEELRIRRLGPRGKEQGTPLNFVYVF